MGERFTEKAHRYLPGIRRVYGPWENGYSVSAVRVSGMLKSYGYEKGLWEAAVMRDGRVCYDTPITRSVIGDLTEAQVDDVVEKVKALGD